MTRIQESVALSVAANTDSTFGRDGAMFEGLLGFVAQLSVGLWSLVVLTAIIRFIGINMYRRSAARKPAVGSGTGTPPRAGIPAAIPAGVPAGNPHDAPAAPVVVVAAPVAASAPVPAPMPVPVPTRPMPVPLSMPAPVPVVMSRRVHAEPLSASRASSLAAGSVEG